VVVIIFWRESRRTTQEKPKNLVENPNSFSTSNKYTSYKRCTLVLTDTKMWKFLHSVDLYICTTDVIHWLLKCSGLSLIIYQIAIYPYVEKATGPISVARISSVSFHLILAIISFQHFHFCNLKYVLLLCFHMQILTIPLLQSYPFIALLSWLSTIHSAKYFFNPKEYSVCKYLCNHLLVILRTEYARPQDISLHDSEKFLYATNLTVCTLFVGLRSPSQPVWSF